MELVKQQTKHGCGVAALATVLGISYWEAVNMLGRDVEAKHELMQQAFPDFPILGVLGLEISALLWRCGINNVRWDNPVSYVENFGLDYWFVKALKQNLMPALITEDFVRKHIKGGGRAILAVNSLNISGAQHYIIVDAGRVLDPSNGRKQYTEVPDHILEAILIKPGRLSLVDIPAPPPVVGTVYRIRKEDPIPPAFMLCDGRSLKVAEHPELFDSLKYTYGGSGEDFRIPEWSSAEFLWIMRWTSTKMT